MKVDAEVRHLRTFVAVAEELSFTRAAKTLGIRQSTASKIVRELERELDVELFERTTHEVRLTPAGATLLDGARQALRSMTTALDATLAVGHGVGGRVCVGYSPLIGPRDHTDVIGVLCPAGSEQSLVLVEVRPEQVPTMLRRREVDLVLTRGAVIDDTELDRAPLRPSSMSLAVPVGHALHGRASTCLRDLDGERLLVWSLAGTDYTDLVADHVRQAGADCDLVEARVTGGGVLLTQQLLEERAVALVPTGTPPPPGARCMPVRDFAAPLWLLWPAGLPPAAVRRLAQAMARDEPAPALFRLASH
jgi:DNA-binding transcriptional LysR family regulator